MKEIQMLKEKDNFPEKLLSLAQLPVAGIALQEFLRLRLRLTNNFFDFDPPMNLALRSEIKEKIEDVAVQSLRRVSAENGIVFVSKGGLARPPAYKAAESKRKLTRKLEELPFIRFMGAPQHIAGSQRAHTTCLTLRSEGYFTD
ncbi:hypothetical protein HAX54_031655 [Datura stramonium]|uniref:Uncharacterized protein n=1 Tax=Datura stramonium TaxID=4076 RepID=A0ABS8VCK2_DATST|nr:hypothetical protein [Datura stramonium]